MVRFLLAAVLVLGAASVRAEPTRVLVRVISQDAKFVGSSMGGVRIVLRNARSGAVLAQGRVEGGTGDTARIMQAAGRSPQRSDKSTAAFAATVDIAQPELVEVEAYGPLAYPASAVRVTQQRWLIPGADAAGGDGWTLELPGLVIEPYVRVTGRKAHVEAKVQPMCGCPIAPDGLWPAAEYEVTAWVRGKGKQKAARRLAFAKAPGLFSGDVELPAGSSHELVIVARNTRTGNSGVRTATVAAQ